MRNETVVGAIVVLGMAACALSLACGESNCTETGSCVGPAASDGGQLALDESGASDARPDSLTGTPREASASFTMNSLAWTGWWDGDNYNPVTGLATGRPSAGPSAGRDALSPGIKPTAGPEANGHRSIVGGVIADAKYLRVASTLKSFVASDAFVVYAVMKVTTSSGVNPSGFTVGAIISESSSHWALGGTVATGPVLDTFHVDSAGVQRDLLLDASKGYSVGTLLVYEARLAAGNLYARINDGPEITQASDAVHPNALGGTLQLLSNFNQGAFFDGLLYEIAITDTPLADVDRQSVRSALRAKYGL